MREQEVFTTLGQVRYRQLGVQFQAETRRQLIDRLEGGFLLDVNFPAAIGDILLLRRPAT